MKFIVKLSNGDRFVVTPEEAKAIVNAEKGDTITLKEKGIMIAKSFVVSVYPESKAKDIENKNQMTGVLFDGTRVKKHFGRWALDQPEYNINGYKVDTIFPDPTYYREIAKDCVATYKEWEEIKNLPIKERLQIILNDNNVELKINRELNSDTSTVRELIIKK